jgi:hypothetical protein
MPDERSPIRHHLVLHRIDPDRPGAGHPELLRRHGYRDL